MNADPSTVVKSGDQIGGDAAAAGCVGTEVGSAARDRGIKAAQQLNLLGEMASGIAHDFRNVLGVIQSALNLTEQHLGDPAAALPLLAAARQSVERGTRLTSRLLKLARPRSADEQVERIPNLIRELAPFLQFAAGSEIRVRLELREDIPDCLVDRPLFNAALLNLVVNARDAMPSGGEIRVRTDLAIPENVIGSDSDTIEWIRVSVIDEGQGMSADTVAHIFEPWFTTKGDSGTGLGLPQVLSFVRSSGGRVAVTSRLGEGTAIELYFPAHGAALTLDLARQTDRWVNEGGSVDDWNSLHGPADAAKMMPDA